MGHESFYAPQEQEPPFDPNFLDTYGLGPEEAATVVTYGQHTGTLASMLTDERCPVGGIVAQAYQENGLAGVEEKFAALSMFSKEFAVPISENTRKFHEGTVGRDELLASTQPPGESDFLA